VIYRIEGTWDGQGVSENDVAEVGIELGEETVLITVSSPFSNDPPPPGPAGPTDGLWDYEVVEVFLLGTERYLEIELSPHGHYLALGFRVSSPRVREREFPSIDYVASWNGDRWVGTARLPRSLVPANADRYNAYRVNGMGPDRRYFAACPVPGDRPDFHRLECFGKL